MKPGDERIERAVRRIEERLGSIPGSGGLSLPSPAEEKLEAYVHELAHLSDMFDRARDLGEVDSFDAYARPSDALRLIDQVKAECYRIRREESLPDLLDWEARVLNRELRVYRALGLLGRLSVRRLLPTVAAPRGWGDYLARALALARREPDREAVSRLSAYLGEFFREG